MTPRTKLTLRPLFFEFTFKDVPVNVALMLGAVTAAFNLAVAPALVMLALGAAHAFDPVVPALSYDATWFVWSAVQVAAGRH